MTTNKNRPYGVGLAYRNGLHREIVRHQSEVDLLEIPTEDYIVRERRTASDPDGALLRDALHRFPSVAHGISMSIGSVERYDAAYMRHTRQMLKEFDIDIFSEHLTYHRMESVDILMFLCMPFDEISLDWLKLKYNAAKDYLGRPYALENVSYYFPVPESKLTEPEFLTGLTERTDCSLLIDVTNIYNNATNYNYDAVKFVEGLPGDRVAHLHLAGGHFDHGMWQDSHSAPVMDGVWDLLHAVLENTKANIIILERDSNFIPFDGVVADLNKAREIFRQHRPATADEADWGDCAEFQTPITPADQCPAELANPDPLDERFAELRNFQMALMRRITQADFRRKLVENANKCLQSTPLSDRWQKRLLACMPERIDLLARKWTMIEKDVVRQEAAYKRRELQAWLSGEAGWSN